MYKTFIQLTQKVEKLGFKHLPVYFETPCSVGQLVVWFISECQKFHLVWFSLVWKAPN